MKLVSLYSACSAWFMINRKKATISIIIILNVALSACVRRTDQVAQTPDSIYVKNGNIIVKATFDSLRNSLLRAIGDGGFEHAITFCNENAFALTNTYADSVSIRRTALRWRNPENEPDSLERSVLQTITSELGTDAAASPKLLRDDRSGEIHYFKPIMMQAMCLNCHGKPNGQISEKTMTKISQLYPADDAVNFSEGDLRGAWHVIFRQIKK